METDNRLLKKMILEQLKLMEGTRRDKTKNNVFVTGIPVSHVIEGVEMADKVVVLHMKMLTLG